LISSSLQQSAIATTEGLLFGKEILVLFKSISGILHPQTELDFL
jgi:hypothetical protein